MKTSTSLRYATPVGKDVFPNIYRTQAPAIAPRQGANGVVRCCCTLFSASAYHSYAAEGDGSAKSVFVPVTLAYVLDIQTLPSEGPNTPSL